MLSFPMMTFRLSCGRIFPVERNDRPRALEGFLPDTRTEIIRETEGAGFEDEDQEILDRNMIKRQMTPPDFTEFNGYREWVIAMLGRTSLASLSPSGKEPFMGVAQLRKDADNLWGASSMNRPVRLNVTGSTSNPEKSPYKMEGFHRVFLDGRSGFLACTTASRRSGGLSLVDHR